MDDSGDETRSVGNVCCACERCYRTVVDSRHVYRCSANGGMVVSMVMRGCDRFSMDSNAAIMARLNHGAFGFKVGCRCATCVKGHNDQERWNRKKKALRTSAREGQAYGRL